MTLTKNLLDCLALAEEANDDNCMEKLDEIEQILKDALDYVRTLRQ